MTSRSRAYLLSLFRCRLIINYCPNPNPTQSLSTLSSYNRYMTWKSDTKLVAWVSLDAGIHSDLSPVSSYPSQITLYRSLHAHWWLILEFTIQEISYSGSPLIMTGAGAGCILLEKMLDVAGLSMDTWKTGWTEHIDSGRRRVNDRVLGWVMIS